MRKTLCFALLLFAAMSIVSLPAMAQANSGTTPVCSLSALLDSVTATTQIVAAPASASSTIYVGGVPTTTTASLHIKICSVHLLVQQTTGAANFGLKYGTGTNCGTGTTLLTPQWVGTASVIDKFDSDRGSSNTLDVPAGKALCFALSAAPTKAQALVLYKLE